MPFKFAAQSIEAMTQTHPVLINAAHYALLISPVDFVFYEGVRSVEKEMENIKKGTSKLKDPTKCMHCVQSDGFGHAMDLVPWIENKLSWDWPSCIIIASKIQQFAFRNNVKIRWGGVWDKSITELGVNLTLEVEAYKNRHHGQAFLDGVHFELPLLNNGINNQGNQDNIA